MSHIIFRRFYIFIICATALAVWPPLACSESSTQAAAPFSYDQYFASLMDNITHPNQRVRQRAFQELARTKDKRAVPALIDLISVDSSQAANLTSILADISDEQLGPRWQDWAAWMIQSDIPTHADYFAFKRDLLLARDPAFSGFPLSKTELTVPIRDIYWTGENKDAAPALMNPAFVSRREAVFLEEGEVVYGVSIGAQARAYPARIVDWHLIVNDILDNRPICIAACPFSGTMVGFRSTRDLAVFTFGYSGLVYLSSLVLYDHQTSNLWSSFDGKAVSGELGRTHFQLTQIPVTQTTWEEWRTRFPNTTVMSLETGYRRPYGEPSPYFEKFSSGRLEFPVMDSFAKPGSDETLDKDQPMIYGLRLGASSKAYPLRFLSEKGVVNDQLNGVNFVLITDQSSGSIRAYQAGSHQFSSFKRFELRDEKGQSWHVEENQLASKTLQDSLARIPGQRSFLSTWNTWHPESKVTYGEGRNV